LGIKPYKEGGEFGGKGAKWFWKLPPQDVEDGKAATQGVEKDNRQHLVANDSDKSIYSNGLPQGVDSHSFQRLVDGQSTSCGQNGRAQQPKLEPGPDVRTLLKNRHWFSPR
jgi:hypothetical protein